MNQYFYLYEIEIKQKMQHPDISGKVLLNDAFLSVPIQAMI
jgi:hypothetical protein